MPAESCNPFVFMENIRFEFNFGKSSYRIIEAMSTVNLISSHRQLAAQPDAPVLGSVTRH
jgi:hypothetical protein